MNFQELHAAKAKMSEQERSRRYKECLERGGCEATMATASRVQDFSTHCLTLYAHGIAQDPPPLPD